MRYSFLADESIEKTVVEWLRSEGYAVAYISELSPGISDTEVLKRASQGKHILITNDKDFGDLIFRKRMSVPGVLLIRAEHEDPADKISLVDTVLKNARSKLTGAFIVVNERGFRIRKIPSPLN